MVRPAAKRRAVGLVRKTFEKSERWACRVLGVSRATQRYRHRMVEPPGLIKALLTLAEQKTKARLPAFVPPAPPRRSSRESQARLPPLLRARACIATEEGPKALRRFAPRESSATQRTSTSLGNGLRERPRRGWPTLSCPHRR